MLALSKHSELSEGLTAAVFLSEVFPTSWIWDSTSRTVKRDSRVNDPFFFPCPLNIPSFYSVSLLLVS